MAVQRLTKAEFDAFKPARGPDVGHIIIEKEWYADTKGNVIGTLTFDQVDKDWGYVLLGRDKTGQYRGIDLEVSLTEVAARAQLRAKLEEYEKSGQTVFPQ